MKNFFRSLRYLWPHRFRLIVAAVCVVLIAVLWAGGLGAILPGAKILLSEEGLHGWAWRSMAEDRLGVRLVPRDVERADTSASVVDVLSAEPGGPAAGAGIADRQWLIGFSDRPEMPARRVLRRLARQPAGQTVRLVVLNPSPAAAAAGNARRTVEVTLGEGGWSARWLVWVANRFEEPQSYPERFPLLVGLLVLAIAITVVRNFLRFWQEYLVETAVWRGIMDIRCQIYSKTLTLPTTFFQAEGVSDTMSRFVSDTPELARGQVTLFGKTLVEPAKAVASIAMAMVLSWQLTLLAMVAGPPAFYLIRMLGKFMKKASRRALESWSQLLGLLEETLNGIRVVKAYTMEKAERQRFDRINERLLKQQRRMARIDAATAPGVEALGISAAMVAVGLGGYWALNRMYEMTPERFLALNACLFAMFDPVRKLSKVVTRFQRSDAAAGRIFELMDREPEKTHGDAPELPRHVETLELRDVNFRYPKASDLALKQINLAIQAGQTVAIVGPNGCGKTTLVSLIPRLIDPTDGAVLIDGHDTAGYSIESLRRQIAVVTQDSVLFHGTVAENIAYGKLDATREEIVAAARAAYVDEFVSDGEKMPDGYETVVGEHGATLSGGQRQRICIARAILRDPAILIFDEAMSQVDAESERKIHEALEAFMASRTTLMIAHRFVTVLSADRIVVMNEGRIIDAGTNEELLQRCDLYRHLHRTQFGAADDQGEGEG